MDIRLRLESQQENRNHIIVRRIKARGASISLAVIARVKPYITDRMNSGESFGTPPCFVFRNGLG